QHVVGNTDDRRLRHGGVFEEGILHIGRVDVVAAPDDDLFGAAHDVKIAVLVEPAEVAGPEPPVGPREGGGRGVAVVHELATEERGKSQNTWEVVTGASDRHSA